MGVAVSTNHKSSSGIKSSQLGQDLFNCWSFDLTPSIDPLTHATTHTPTHGWGCQWVNVSTNSLQIINLQTELNYLDYVKIY